MHRKYLVGTLAVTLFTVYAYISSGIGHSDSMISSLKKHLPEESKTFLKETLFVYKNQQLLKQKIAEKNREVEEIRRESEQRLKQNRRIIDYQNTELARKNRLLVDLSRNQRSIVFTLYDPPLEMDVGDRKYLLKKFKTNTLLFGKHPGAIGSSYLDYFDKKLYIMTATGVFGYVDTDKLSEDNFSVNTVKTNISELVTYKEFFESSKYGIKDILIYRNRIYVSYSNQLKRDCFNTSILVADLDLKQLVFEKFFVPKICVDRENVYGWFNPHNSGGRMVPFGDNAILFSVGEYQYRDHAQDESNVLGKIVAIGIKTKESKIISKGHRNPQGLFYNEEANEVFSTEHGPQGGDEININVAPGEEIENYGWPVSSYGEHYGYDVRDDTKKVYQQAPLYKSHKGHGFIEPLKYFTPSIAISEIIRIPFGYNGVRKKQLFVAAMGNKLQEGDMSIHHLVLNVDNTIYSHDTIPINERIRDMVYVKESKKVYLFLESTASIGVMTVFK